MSASLISVGNMPVFEQFDFVGEWHICWWEGQVFRCKKPGSDPSLLVLQHSADLCYQLPCFHIDGELKC